MNWAWSLGSQGNELFLPDPSSLSTAVFHVQHIPTAGSEGREPFHFSALLLLVWNLGFVSLIFVLWVQFPDMQRLATWACFY